MSVAGRSMLDGDEDASTSAGVALFTHIMPATRASHLFMEEDVMLLCFLVPLISLIYELIARCWCGAGQKEQRAKVVAPATPTSPLNGTPGAGWQPGSIYPLTEEQLDAYWKAKKMQQVLFNAARKAPREEKERVDPKWRRNGGQALEDLLPGTPLIDAQYLLCLSELGGILPPREEMPACALIDDKSAWRLRTWQGFSSLSALVVSMPWLDPEHPDKHGEQLRALAPILIAVTDAAQDMGGKHATVGVFVEYSCLPYLSTTDDHLINRIRWFSHPCTHVLLLNQPSASPGIFGLGGGGGPRYADSRSFGSRGWQLVEERASCMLKYSHCYWEMANYAGGSSFEEIYKSLPAERKPLLSPPQLRQLLEEGTASGQLSFPKPTDLEAACMLYEGSFLESFESFYQVCPGRTNLFLENKAWGAEEASLIAQALNYAAHHCMLKKELTVHVAGGAKFAAAGSAIADAVKGTAIRIKL